MVSIYDRLLAELVYEFLLYENNDRTANKLFFSDAMQIIYESCRFYLDAN